MEIYSQRMIRVQKKKGKLTTNAEEMLYTVKEVAKLLHTNPGYVYRLRDAGLLKFMRLGSLRVRKVTLEAFLEKYDGMDLFDPFRCETADKRC